MHRYAILPALSAALLLTGCGTSKKQNDHAAGATDYPVQTVTEPKRYNHGNYDPENSQDTNALGSDMNDMAGDVIEDGKEIVSDVAEGGKEIVSDVADAGRDAVDKAKNAAEDIAGGTKQATEKNR